MRIKTKRLNGTFVRTREIWTPDNWDDGYIDNKGRFRVYRPDYPRAYSEGYCLRSHVVWWLEHGEPHPKGEELHHKDGSKDNDKIDNLISLSKSEHRNIHQSNWKTITCVNCGKSFQEHAWRVNGRGRKFCSYDCFHAFPKIKKRKIVFCEECGEPRLLIESDPRKFCSNSCAQKYTWRKRKCLR